MHPRGLVTLTRPGNVVMTMAAVLAGAYVAAGGAAFDGLDAMAAGALAAGLIAAAGNALNDLLDRSIDATAHPTRPLVTGAVSVGGAQAFAVAAAAAGLASAAYAGIEALGLATLALLGLAVYERFLKARGLVGNAAVSLLAGLTFVYGGVVVGVWSLAALLLGVLAALANLGREIVKDVEDLDADVGRRTLPMRIGAGPAMTLARGALVFGVVLSPLPYFVTDGFGVVFLGVVAVADGVFVAAALTGAPGRASRLAKVAMVTALAAFILGRAFPAGGV